MGHKSQVVYLCFLFFNMSTIKAPALSKEYTQKSTAVFQVSQSCVDGQWRRPESRDSVALWESGRNPFLSRSRSMDVLPQRESSGTRALCALFESKATLKQNFHSSPRLNVMPAPGSKTGRDCPLQEWRSHNTPLKETTVQVRESYLIQLLARI